MQGSRIVPALAGLGFAAAVLVEVLAFPDSANSTDPPAVIAGYYQHHGATDLVVDHISLVAVPLLVLFLCGAIGRLTGAASRFAQVAVMAAAVFAMVATAIEITLAAQVGAGAPATTTAALFEVSSRMFLTSMLWLGLAVGTFAGNSQEPRWLRGLGGVTALTLVGAGLAVAHPHGALGVLVLPAEALLVVWVVVTAVAGLRRKAPVAIESRRRMAA